MHQFFVEQLDGLRLGTKKSIYNLLYQNKFGDPTVLNNVNGIGLLSLLFAIQNYKVYLIKLRQDKGNCHINGDIYFTIGKQILLT